MYSLFLDTHDIEIIIGIYKDGLLIDSLVNSSNRHHSDILMPSISDILSRNNIDVKELGEILVVNGPGSFTGVRLGVTIAKTLAYTLNIPIKTITSLEVIMLSNDCNLPIIHDVKGVFGGIFENNNLVGDYFYKSNEEFNDFIKDENYQVCDKYDVDFNNVYKYMLNKKSENPHSVNPIYIKVIEALKND
jgi:tRNA threonylcarbamoyl adenosine modification protein YeaZ